MNNTDPTYIQSDRLTVSTDLQTWISLGMDDDDDDIERTAQARKSKERKAVMFEWLRNRKN